MDIGKNYIGVSAGIVLRNTEGRFFLAKRGKDARDDQGKWEFPGGTILLFEMREDAVRRNIYEKYHINIGDMQILGVYDVIDIEKGDHWLSTTYIAKDIVDEGRNIIPEKCDNIGWFTLDDISKMSLSRISSLNYSDIQKNNIF